jgi:hypothetical protein
MAERQATLAGGADFAAVDAAMGVLSCSELTRGADHARQSRAVLALAEAQRAAAWEIATVAQIALALGCSESRAGRLLTEAQALVVLPGALEAVECGLLTVEQSATVIEQLAVLDPAGQVAVWRRLQQRLIDAADGTVAPPARLTETLRRWVIAYDKEASVRRRREAERSRGLDYRRQQDGLYDLFARGLHGPDAHAILCRIAARSRPWGSDDDRSADQRRLDAFRDLLLGRDQLPLQPLDEPMSADGCDGGSCPRCALRAAGAAACGCLPGQPVPCGADISVFMTAGAGLGTTDELAELVGHGPLEPDLLLQLLLAGAVLRPVWLDEHGVPVAVGDKTIRLERGDPAAVRAALLALQNLPPPPAQPRHPLDHQPHDRPDDHPSERPAAQPLAPAGALRPPDLAPVVRSGAVDARVLADAALGRSGAHPSGTPGSYRPPRWMRRLIELRAPRCEWPGCGARAVKCDAEHDRAWPQGPTCPCNLGPCCRRHHRIKQLGFRKTRSEHSAVTWTDPSGRSWHSPHQHEPPAAPIRAPAPVPTPNPLDQLSPHDLDEELWHLDLLPDDFGPWTSPPDREPADTDRMRNRILHTDTRWGLDLADPHRWQPDAA